MIFQGKRVTVFGLGKSGIAAAKKLVSLGAKVFASDASHPAVDLPGVTVELGGHTESAIKGTDLIVVSPGIHLDIPVLEKAKQKGIPIISEIELAYQLLKKPIIAVTGTNGKTTTTTLIGEMLKAGGKKVAVAGNIGAPLVEVNDARLDYSVAEISSYQLESIDQFKPWISIILNIQPDHLERHKTIKEYIKQKARVFMNQTGDDYIVYNLDDPAVVKMVKKAKARKIGFSKKGARIITRLPGKHNIENALAAAQAAYLCGVKKTAVARALKTFPGVEHRIEFTRKLKGVEFYNDSKGTNPDSTLVALDTFAGRGIILILGGREKGVSLVPLVKKVKQTVKAVMLIGEAADVFEKALRKGKYNSIYRAASMDDAVKGAYALAKRGDVVLLSPACASFDMFANFEERGKIFKAACKNLS